MNIKMLYTTKNFKLIGDYKKFEFIQFKVTDDPRHKESLISPIFLQYFGKKGLDELNDGPVFYAEHPLNTKNTSHLEEDEIDQMNTSNESSIQHLNNLLHFTWFIRDNNVDGKVLYTQAAESIGEKPNGHRISTCGGDIATPHVITVEELEHAKKLYIKYSFKCRPGELEAPDPSKPTPPFFRKIEIQPFSYSTQKKVEDLNKISRAIMFLTYARNAPSLPTKISFHVCLYECLFSNNENTEITHKIAERIAFYMGRDASSKKGIFRLVKTAYAIRSKVFRGQLIDPKLWSNIISISNEIDELSRKVLLKILNTDIEKFTPLEPEILSQYFTDLLFGS